MGQVGTDDPRHTGNSGGSMTTVQVCEGVIDPRVLTSACRVFRAVNLPVPKVWGMVPPCDCGILACSANAMLAVSFRPPHGVALAAGINVAEMLTETELDAVLLHECGHVYYGDVFRIRESASTQAEEWESEFRADRFAIQHGGAAGLLSALRKLLAGDPNGGSVGSPTHPPLMERIRRLQHWLDTRTVAAAA